VRASPRLVEALIWHALLATTSGTMVCDMVRSDTGYADHRTLYMPATMWDAAGEVEKVWADKLCCIYTWVVRDASAASPFLITYDGGRRSYDNAASFVSAADCVYSAVCAMSMGQSDCTTAAQRCPATSTSTGSQSLTQLASSTAVAVREYQAVGMLCRPKNADGYSISLEVASAAACREKCEADKDKCGAFEYEYVPGDDRECELHEKTKVDWRATQAMGPCLLQTEGAGNVLLDAPVLGKYRCCWMLKEHSNTTTSAVSYASRCATSAFISSWTQMAAVVFVMAFVWSGQVALDI